MIHILIIDDHEIIRHGLRLLIGGRPEMVIVGEAANSKNALELAAQKKPDIIILDLLLGDEDGADLLPQLMKVAPHARVIILTGSGDASAQSRAVANGAFGLVYKDQASAVLLQAIDQVLAGGVWLDPTIIAKVQAERVLHTQRRDPEAIKIALLSERECEIIALVGEGLKNKIIAERLFITEHTVRNHLASIFKKLNVPDRFGLAIYAYRNGLAEIPE